MNSETEEKLDDCLRKAGAGCPINPASMFKNIGGYYCSMCDFCNDLRNIEPASYLGGGDAEFQEWIKEKRKKKAFIMYHNIDDEFVELIVVEKCPVCGHVFTEEEYDELTFW